MSATNKLDKEPKYNLNAGKGWRLFGEVFVGLDVLVAVLDIAAPYIWMPDLPNIDPIEYVTVAILGLSSYIVGHCERSHQTNLYVASKLERIANHR